MVKSGPLGCYNGHFDTRFKEGCLCRMSAYSVT